MGALGCDRPRDGAPPPPPVEAAPAPSGACPPPSGRALTSGIEPLETSGFCLDAGTDVRIYGGGVGASLDQACLELLNGECEVYRAYGLERVQHLSYQSRKVSGARVVVTWSDFATELGAFGFYTRRVLSGGAPSAATVREVEAPGRLALGTGVAYALGGRRLAELTYVSDTETPAEIERHTESEVEPFARTLLERAATHAGLPHLARLVDVEGRVPLGFAVAADGIFGLSGVGFSVTAYVGGTEPHRLVAFEAPDEHGAEDIEKLLLSVGRVTRRKESRYVLVDAPSETGGLDRWLVARRDRVVYAVGPELGARSILALPPAEREDSERAFEVRAKRFLDAAVAHARTIDVRGSTK